MLPQVAHDDHDRHDHEHDERTDEPRLVVPRRLTDAAGDLVDEHVEHGADERTPVLRGATDHHGDEERDRSEQPEQRHVAVDEAELQTEQCTADAGDRTREPECDGLDDGRG